MDIKEETEVAPKPKIKKVYANSSKRRSMARKAFLRTPAGKRARRVLAKRMKALHKEKPEAMSNTGIPRGMTRAQATPLWEAAREAAKDTMTKLIEHGVVSTKTTDDQAAAEALEAALTIMRSPIAARERLTAAKTVLDFTKAKPAIRQDVTVSNTEAWLKSVIEDDKSGSGAA